MTARDFTNSEKFKDLVRTRWTFSFIMLAILFVIYYGYIYIVAEHKEIAAIMVGKNVTLGIVLCTAVIVGSWILTLIYVVWANNVYDKKVESLKKDLQ
ncbi:DUF485 domain-containing protein [Seleniivibrio woodruffii]|jgi:uncharacterized membrane protein (DUF485 family)|uniref:DUF485 domain-containing protein n=1 Tax=Seleniivibrio woodruffii TaxID=1078050 RepID=UPI0026F0A411|nr:DUF485 domain-containing protein [Seleniivibrio woodruffii]